MYMTKSKLLVSQFIFNPKTVIFFRFLFKNILWYSLEVPLWGTSNKYSHVFVEKSDYFFYPNTFLELFKLSFAQYTKDIFRY